MALLWLKPLATRIVKDSESGLHPVQVAGPEARGVA